MKIKSVEVNNFKSLLNFKINLSQFTCLIGLNGSGKSTVLQCIDFAPQLVIGDMEGWLAERKWENSDLKSKLSKKGNIYCKLTFAGDKGQKIGFWKVSYNPSKHRCTREEIEVHEDNVVVKDGKYHINSTDKAKITFDYEGSILSVLKEDLLPPSILELKNLLKEVQSLDLLSPEQLRQRTRHSSGSLGLGGQKLASFLHEIGPSDLNELTTKLKKVYPQLESLGVKSLRSGWKELGITENYQGYMNGSLGLFPRMMTKARHLNDGMLRLIAILAELHSKHSFLLFDEIENGINPELIEFVIDSLVTTDKQLLVTTHSPLILNYLSDDVATDGVIYLYKTLEGQTKAIPFFAIPSMAEKLTVMGPGEVFVDTILTELQDEIQFMVNEEL